MPRQTTYAIPDRLERSMLFVPASDWSMIEKAAASSADAVCLDLEDSVVADAKAASRTNAIRAFNELGFGRQLRMLRINGLDTPFAYRDLIEVIEGAGDRVDLVMIPKVGSREDIAFVDTMLTQIEMNCGFARCIGIEAQIETAAGFLYVREIARSSPRLETLIFGPGDYAASMRIPSSGIGEFDANDETYPGHRWHAVMHAIVASARANGLRCVDGPYARYKDAVGFERSCSIARALGFEGKQCIHPDQLSMANSIFSPTVEESARAHQIVDAHERAVASGRSAVGLDGRLVDVASLRMAQVVLEQDRLSKRALEVEA